MSPAWWPVNVEGHDALPPPAELRDLPLDLLIDILTSAKPLHQIVIEWRQREAARLDRSGSTILDAHRRVDTSSFLLQRTRRISRALAKIRERLERPAASEHVLNWRLSGPIGVRALANAIDRTARSPIERGFLLAELCLELKQVKPQESPGNLPAGQVRAKISGLANEIRATVLEKMESTVACDGVTLPDPVNAAACSSLRSYVKSVFEEAP